MSFANELFTDVVTAQPTEASLAGAQIKGDARALLLAAARQGDITLLRSAGDQLRRLSKDDAAIALGVFHNEIMELLAQEVDSAAAAPAGSGQRNLRAPMRSLAFLLTHVDTLEPARVQALLARTVRMDDASRPEEGPHEYSFAAMFIVAGGDLAANALVRLVRDHAFELGAVVGRTSQATLLHYAAVAGNNDLAWMLVDAGASVDALDRHGQAPGDYARHGGHYELAMLLEKRMTPKAAGAAPSSAQESEPAEATASVAHEAPAPAAVSPPEPVPAPAPEPAPVAVAAPPEAAPKSAGATAFAQLRQAQAARDAAKGPATAPLDVPF